MNIKKCICKTVPGIAAAVIMLTAVSGCGDAKQVEAAKSYRKTGLQLLDAGDYEKAIQSFNEALGQRAGIVSNLEEDINFYKAYAQMESGKTKDAVSTYTALIEYNKKNADAYYLRGCAYISQGKKKEALQDFEEAEKNKKDSGAMCAGIYEQLMAAGLEKEAAPYLKQGLSVKGEKGPECLTRGKLYLLSGDYEKAETELGEALEQKEPSAELYLGRLFQAKGDSGQSANYYEAYLQDNPNDSAVLYELGQLAFVQGEYDKAVTWFDQGMGCENIMNKRALWSGKIAALEYAGDFPAALQEMENYLENYPQDDEAQKEYIFLKTR